VFSEEGSVDILQLVLEKGAVEGKVFDSIPSLKSSSSPYPCQYPRTVLGRAAGTRWIWAFSLPETAKKTSNGEI